MALEFKIQNYLIFHGGGIVNRILIGLLFCLVTTMQSAFSSIESFDNRFKFIRENGNLVRVQDRSLSFGFSIAPYLNMIKEQLKNEQLLMAKASLSGHSYEEEVSELLADDIVALSDKSSEKIQHIIKSLHKVGALDIDKLFESKAFQSVIKAFELKLSDALEMINPSIIANLEDSRFFYKRNVTYKVVTWGLNFAKKKLSSIPLLNTASYVLVEVEKMIRVRRLYHQNMFLHYLEMFPESELGLTKPEANLIFSSIYESRIEWFNKWESDSAARNWNKYGANKFYQSFRLATSKLRKFSSIYSTRGSRLNYAFQEVSMDGQDMIINLFNSEAMFNSRPAIAFYKDSPNKVARKRMLLRVAQLGLSFLSLPNWIKENVTKYAKSHYETQQITEGALFAHFEIMKNHKMMNNLLLQYQNPYDAGLILE